MARSLASGSKPYNIKISFNTDENIDRSHLHGLAGGKVIFFFLSFFAFYLAHALIHTLSIHSHQAECDCKEFDVCKHVVATLIAWLDLERKRPSCVGLDGRDYTPTAPPSDIE